MRTLPAGWTDVALGDVCDIVSGATPKTSVDSYWGGDVRWATPKDLSDLSGKRFLSDTPRTLTTAGLRACGAPVLPPGSVLFSSRAPIGLTAINTTAVATNQGFKSLIPSDRVDVGYLYWWLTTNRRRMEALGRGATFKEVSKAIVAGVRIPLPPLEEQRRIAAVLDKADEVRAKRRAALEQLDMLTQSIFLDMFGDVDPSTSSWPSAKVGSFVSHFEAGKSLVAVADEDAAGPYRVLKVSAVTSWEYSPEESKAVPAGYVPPSAHVVRRNDLLFSRANTSALVGATAMVHDTPTNLLLSDKLWRFVFSDPGDADPYFVWALFRSRHVRDAVMRRATGTSGSMKNISQKKVLGIEVAWPPQDLRREFSRRARLAQHNRLRTRDAAEGCDTLFASLQSRAFRGEL